MSWVIDEPDTEAALPKKTQGTWVVDEKPRKFTKKEIAKDVGKQVAVKGTKGIAGAYGNLLDLIRAQTKQRTLPGQQALYEAEFNAPPELLPFLQDEDILPRYSRLPSGEEAEQLLKMVGAPTEGETPAGRIAGRGAEFVGGALPFGGGSAKLLAGLGAAGLGGQGIREAGGPEALATGVELIPAVTSLAQLGKGLLPKKTPVTKPSGLPERKFESLKKQTKVFPETHKRAVEAIESDFRSLTSDLLKKTNKSYEAILEDPEFKSKISDLFRKVESSAAEYTEPTFSRSMVKTLNKELEDTGRKGMTISDAEKVKSKYLRRYLKDSTKKSTATQRLDQYRKNNEELSKLFPYGDKALENIGRREALEAYQRAIASGIEENYPNSEFSDLFKFTNKRWSEIKKIETLDKYLDALFSKDKIKFSHAEKALTDPKRAERLKNAIGKETFEDFKQLNKDLLSQENALKLLQSKGYKITDLSNAVKSYLVKPGIAKTLFGVDFLQKVYRRTLSDPKKVRQWRNALKDMKKGKVENALSTLNTLAKEDED
jgi:hypothetical protein